MTAPEHLGFNYRGTAWSDGFSLTRVSQPDGSYAEGVAALAYVWTGSLWVAVPGDGTSGMKVQVVSGGSSPPTAVLNGGKAIAVTHTAVQLPTGACNGVIITANSNNAANIYIGKSTVTDDRNATTSGAELQPGQSIGLAIDNLNRVYVNGTIGDGVNWLAS